MSWDGLFFSLDNLARGLKDFLGITPTSVCRLHACDEEGILVADDASMASLVRVHGSLRLVGDDEFEACVELLSATLSTALARSGHAVQFVFSCDPERAGEVIGRAMDPMRVTAKNLGLSLENVLDDWEKALAHYCAAEEIWLVVWTRPTILSRGERGRAAKENAKAKTAPVRRREAMDAGVAVTRMRDIHKALVKEVCDRFEGASFRVECLDAHRAVAALRRMNAPESTGAQWRPVLAGDPLPLRARDVGSHPKDATTCFPPTISRQIWPCQATVHDGRCLEVDGYLYAPLQVTLPPQSVLPFSSLFRSLLSEGLPWRASFLLTGDGLKGSGLKSVAASILSFASPTNRMLQQSFNALKERALAGGCSIGLQMCFVTWVRLSNHESFALARNRLSRHQARLSSAVQAWGACDTSPTCGDVLALYAASLPAMAPTQPSVKAIAPLEEAVRLLPLFRPTSPWNATDVPLRTSDGKYMPVGLFHSIMASWNEVCFAGMGSGKSFFLNTLNFFFVLRAGQTRLPWLTVIDVGKSCSGLIELIRAALPASERHLAVFAALRNVREAAINPFDTPLGCPEPLPNHANFLVNLLSLLCTPLGETAPADGVVDILREGLDAVYRRLAPQGPAPRRFDAYAESSITRWLQENHVRTDNTTSWWEVVKELYLAGEIPLAIRAQRHAVPLVTDLLVELNDPLIRDRFANVTLKSSAESVPEACVRHLTTALREYPILCAPTRFALGAAQIVGLDLSEVTPRGGPAAERQSGIMYLLARFVGAGHFFNTVADLDRVPELYRPWHKPRFENLAADPKRLCYDEFHRASCQDMANPLSRQIISDLTTASREARKQNLSIGLYSQQLSDFPKVLVDLATSVYALGAGNAAEAGEIAERFGLNEAARYALRHITRPTRAGANFVALFRTSLGESIQYLTCTAGSLARWAFTTTAEDMRVRNRLYETMGCAKALACLARAYPEGTVKEELERRRLAMEARLGEAPEDLADTIVAELEESARRMAEAVK